MNLLFDTNIIIYIARSKMGFNMLQYLNPEQQDIHLSFATIAEVESLPSKIVGLKVKFNA